MDRVISLGEVHLGLRLIVKAPVLSATVVLALAVPARRALGIKPAEALSAD